MRLRGIELPFSMGLRQWLHADAVYAVRLELRAGARGSLL